MDFAFSETQQQFGESVRRLLSKSASSERMRASLDREPNGYDRALWNDLAELGALGAAIPEEDGGLGLSDLELCVVAEELGRALARVPFSSTVYWGAEALVRFGSSEQRSRWLPAIADGSAIATFVDTELDMDVSLVVDGDELTGVLPVVPDGLVADLLIVATREAMWLVDTDAPGLSRDPLGTIDLLQPSACFTLTGVKAEKMPAGDIATDLPRLRNRAAILVAFEQIGGSDAALEGAIVYAKERKAFGRAIGSFQAVKHLLANIYVVSTLGRSNAYYAAWALAVDHPSLPQAAAAAHLSATAAFRKAAADTLQVHGGIGFTWELDCHFRYRRANRQALSLGPERRWENQLIDALVAQHQLAECK